MQTIMPQDTEDKNRLASMRVTSHFRKRTLSAYCQRLALTQSLSNMEDRRNKRQKKTECVEDMLAN